MATPSREASEPPIRFIMGAMALGMIVGAIIAPPSAVDIDTSAILAASLDDVAMRSELP